MQLNLKKNIYYIILWWTVAYVFRLKYFFLRAKLTQMTRNVCLILPEDGLFKTKHVREIIVNGKYT
jgi:hypothetical protein